METMKDLFNAKDFIKAIGFKTELGYKTIRHELFNADDLLEAQDWLMQSDKNTVDVLTGDLWGDINDVKKVSFTMKSLIENNQDINHKID